MLPSRALCALGAAAACTSFHLLPARRACAAPLPPAPAPRPRLTLADLDALHDNAQQQSRRAVLERAQQLLERDDAPEVHWRVGRALHQVAMEPGTLPAERRALLARAYAEVTAAKADLPQGAVRERGAVYRWSGIVLSDLSALQGTREAIQSAYAIRSDFEEALEMDPTDASAHHLLGQWAFQVATLGAWTRWLASTLFAEPPSATLEEAVESFERAEELAPGFWKANQAMLAKAKLALGDAQGARAWAARAAALPTVTEDDRTHHQAALDILAKVPPPPASA